MRKKLLDEVSMQELQQYRADGYTNAEIAEMLDVHTQTINRLLGKMPPELQSKAKKQAWATRTNGPKPVTKPLRIDRLETLPVATVKPEPVEESPVTMLTLNEIITVSGTARKYTIDRSAETVMLESTEGSGEMLLRYEDIDTLIIELRMIRRKMGDSIKVGIEPW